VLPGRGEGPQEQRQEDQKGQQHQRHFGLVVITERRQPRHTQNHKAPSEGVAAEQGDGDLSAVGQYTHGRTHVQTDQLIVVIRELH
jgi:hypothetical protein